MLSIIYLIKIKAAQINGRLKYSFEKLGQSWPKYSVITPV